MSEEQVLYKRLYVNRKDIPWLDKNWREIMNTDRVQLNKAKAQKRAEEEKYKEAQETKYDQRNDPHNFAQGLAGRAEPCDLDVPSRSSLMDQAYRAYEESGRASNRISRDHRRIELLEKYPEIAELLELLEVPTHIKY